MKVLSFLKLLITAVEFVLIYDIIGVNSSNAYASKVRLKSVSPPSGGVNGGTQMIIIGSGFALNQFNFGEGNSHLGNEIIFYSSTRTYICDINQYGCTSTRLECFTRPMVEGYYLLQLKIDGNDIPLEQTNNSAFYVRSGQTPTIHKLEPVFTVPQSLLTLSGTLFTDRYGNNVATASNGRSESIQRVYIGGNKCELLRPDIPDTLYGLKLINTNTNNNEGTMKCKMEGTYVGPQNISFIVDGPYGRSKPTIETMHIMPGDKIAMVLTYPEIDSIDKHSGGIAGGTNLVVTGKNFDKANTNVFIDGHECETTSVTQWEIQCSTPPKPNLNSTPSIFPGEVGLLLEKWNNFTSSVGIEDIYKLTEDHPGYSFHHINEFHYTTSDENTVVRLTGFFLPPKDAMYSFKYRSHYFQHVAIFFSGDQFPENVEQLNGNNVFELHKGQRYFIQLVGQHKNRPGYISLDIYSPTASYLHSQTVDVVQEQQKIRFDSEQKSEIQTFEFVSIESQNSTNSTNSTNEIQKITVTGNGDGYLLSFDNVWTGKISLYDSPSDIENKLNKLSSIKPDTVSVTTGDGEEDSGLSYLVEFNTKRGDVKLITAKALNPGLYVNITEIIPGVSSLEMIQLSLNDVVTEQFDVDAPLTAVQRAIENLFRPICEEEVIKPEYAVFASDFESSFPSSYYLGSTYTGDSYCGLKSSRNAHKIVVSGTEREFDVDPIGTYVCFAYRAIGKSIIQPDVRFYFTGTKFAADGKQIITHKTVKIYFDFINDDRWHYLCKNVYEDIMMESDVIYDSMHVYDAIIYFKGSWLLDTLSILHQSEKPFIFENGVDIPYRRAPLPKRVSKILAKRVDGQIQVEIQPLDCSHDFGLIVPYNSEEVDGKYRQTNWPSEAGFRVIRDQNATHPISGTFSLTFSKLSSNGGDPTRETVYDLPVDIDSNDLKIALETISIGDVTVNTYVSCKMHQKLLRFDTLYGDQMLVEVDSSNMRGPALDVRIQELGNGGTFYRPGPGWMFRYPEKKPQVITYVNYVPSKCNGDCSFAWDTSISPMVTSISPTTGSEGTSVVIIGTKFSTDISKNSVTIGGQTCVVNTATETQLSCTVGIGHAGLKKVTVKNLDLGTAVGSFNFKYVHKVSSFSPESSPLSGGTHLTIHGKGFTKNVIVTVDGKTCPLVTVEMNSIKCVIPAANTQMSVAVNVTIDGSEISSSESFKYVTSNSFITNINVTNALVDGTTAILISGSNFGDTPAGADILKLGSSSAKIIKYSNISIEAILPSNEPGSYPIQLHLFGEGLSDIKTNNIQDITYTLDVDAISPRAGSLFGGTNILIEGHGFSNNAELNRVTIDHVTCTVTNVSEKSLTCQLANTGKVHTVSNMGEHPVNGKGFSWYPKILDIKIGDTVKWVWKKPKDLVSLNIEYKVCETATPMAIECMPNGFKSFEAGEGSFTYRFIKSALYHYWSGFVGNTDGFRGQIRVSSRLSTYSKVSVKINGIEAIYNADSGKTVKEMATVCPEIKGFLSPCSNSINTQAVLATGKNFVFNFNECLTPTVSSIFYEHATEQPHYTVEIIGNGLGNETCQADVKINGDVCAINEITQMSLKCNWIPQSAMTVGYAYDLQRLTSVSVLNRGFARFHLDNTSNTVFNPVPVIVSVFPLYGSVAGGTEIMIKGLHLSSLSSTTAVSVGSYSCTSIKDVTPTSVTCLSPERSSPSLEIITLTVSINDNLIQAKCNASTDCTFEYSYNATPSIISVTHTISGKRANLTITGTNFGKDINSLLVSFAGISCTVSMVEDDSVQCTTENVIAGRHLLKLFKIGEGFASGFVYVNVVPDAPSMHPSSGSNNGGLEVVLDGIGFRVDNNTKVYFGSKLCHVTAITSSKITCVTPANGPAYVDVIVEQSNGTIYPAVKFMYADAKTPEVTKIYPTTGTSGSTITISGTGFSTVIDDTTVVIGKVICNILAVNATQITCGANSQSAGTYPVHVAIKNKGYATSKATFEFVLVVSSFLPTTGGFAGCQTISINGEGFITDETTVTICDDLCDIQSLSPDTISCIVHAHDGDGQLACNLVVKSGSRTISANEKYTFDESLTAQINSVTPGKGGTAGGTKLTISGNGFGNEKSSVDVIIDGSVCNISFINDMLITCTTTPHRHSIKAKVEVNVKANGCALHNTEENFEFYYIDRWSSIYTWGGTTLPQEGDMVVILSGQTLLLDIANTPTIKMVLINGGTLLFDEMDIELNVENILITGGGSLVIGSEDMPFQHKAIITLHGHMRSPELPVYGTKTLAVRDGTLEVHGRYIQFPHTTLSQTANAGSVTIHVKDMVDWQQGDRIVIASTGLRHSQEETEIGVVSSIDGFEITLTEPIKYKHISIKVTYGSENVEMSAEVGLLTRNVVIRGSDDSQWHDQIPACDDGFDTGQFAVQTCFQGRFGEEIGSDQFGAAIMLSPSAHGKVQCHIDSVEITQAGQAFRLGRYPLHFHMAGHVDGSYVRGCSIHRTFNRAVVIHGTHDLLVENNVIYDVMGGALFLEDGIETGNILQYNLVLFVKSSSSLINDDITPAAFWITNPNNTVRHNSVAGGTHFGFWYRLQTHPDGPSYTNSVCPLKVQLGEFSNNTVHSVGWYGLWIFERYYPTIRGSCADSFTQSHPAVFETLTTWHSDKCAELVDSGAIHLLNFKCLENEKAGIEVKLVQNVPLWGDKGAKLDGSLIVGRVPEINLPLEVCTQRGVVLPLSPGLLLVNTTFFNFDLNGTCAAIGVARITGRTSFCDGGFHSRFSTVKFTNTPNKAGFTCVNEIYLKDLDGSLAGGDAGSSVAPTSSLLPSICSPSVDFSKNIAASICPPSVKLVRFAFNNAGPTTLHGKSVLFESRYGSQNVPYRFKGITHKYGWMINLIVGETYEVSFENSDHLTNISYSGSFYGLMNGDCIIMQHKFMQNPDHFYVWGSHRNVTELTCNDNLHGDWHFNEFTKVFSYLVSGRLTARKRRGLAILDNNTIRNVNLKIYRCYHKNCIESEVDDRDERLNATYMSADECWPNATKPQKGEDFILPKECWIVVDVPLPYYEKCIIKGVLEFEHQIQNSTVINFVLNCTIIFIDGGRIIAGWKTHAFANNLRIILRGDHMSPDMPLQNGPNIGAKSIGVFGGLDLYGKQKISWTHMNSSAAVGSIFIDVEEEVDWSVFELIAITSTSYSASETEIRTIVKIENNTRLFFDVPLLYTHLVYSESISGKIFYKSCEVGLLSRNIRIEGEPFPEMEDQLFGARLLVGKVGKLTGYARISNVEFYKTGQEGWTEPYDPRFSLSFLNIGDVAKAKRKSFVDGCVFHHGFSTSIGAFHTDSLVFKNNVIHHSIGPGMRIEGKKHIVSHNLVMMSLWPGSINGRDEPLNLIYHAGIEINKAASITLTENTVAGSERAGYKVAGISCFGKDEWENNVAHSNMLGVIVLPPDGHRGCMTLKGFTVFNSWKYGIYSQTASNTIVKDVILADNGVGILLLIVTPSIKLNRAFGRYAEIKNSLIIGRSKTYDCQASLTGKNLLYSSTSDVWTTNTNGSIGVGWTVFLSSFNGAPKESFDGDAGYTTFDGLTRITDTTFYRFGTTCNGENSSVISTLPKIEDMFFPIEMKSISLIEVESKVFMHTPNVKKVNSADCVDMPCDAKKKCIIRDLDGSFISTEKAGTILPISEFEWDGDPRYGVGNNRIPLTALMDRFGERLDVNDVAPYKGIYRESCTKVETWPGYQCDDKDSYRMMVMASLDSDTEKRRISPIAFIGDMYVDLLNGPQDHGWCSGYTCRLRVSTFHMIVSTGRHYDVYLSGSNPQKMRFQTLHADNADVIRLGIHYNVPYRLDVYAASNLIDPSNIQHKLDGSKVLKHASDPNQFLPNLTSVAGTNWHDRIKQKLFIIMRSSVVVDVYVSKMIILHLSLPAMTVDEFFDSANIVLNLATFLNIPINKIRVVHPVVENQRKRRSVDSRPTLKLSLEIGDEAAKNTTYNVTNELTELKLLDISNSIVDAVQAQTFENIINATVESVSVVNPIPSVESSDWVQHNGNTGNSIPIQIPKKIIFIKSPISGEEGLPFTTQPLLQLVDSEDNDVRNIGTESTEWTVESFIHGEKTNVTLIGQTKVKFINGRASFSNLGISRKGSYIVRFSVVSPVSSSLSVDSESLEVRPMSLFIDFYSQPDFLFVDENFTLKARLLREVDKSTPLFDKETQVHSEISVCDDCLAPGNLSRNFFKVLHPPEFKAVFQNLRLQTQRPFWKFFIKMDVSVNHSNIAIGISKAVTVFPLSYVRPKVNIKRQCELKFDADYKTTVGIFPQSYCMVSFWNAMQSKVPDVVLSDISCKTGSIIVKFNIDGEEATVNSALFDLHSLVESGLAWKISTSNTTTVLYADKILLVDGVRFGVETAPSPLNWWRRPEIIAVFVIAIVIITVTIVAVSVYFSCFRQSKNTKISQIRKQELKRFNAYMSGELAVASMRDPSVIKSTAFSSRLPGQANAPTEAVDHHRKRASLSDVNTSRRSSLVTPWRSSRVSTWSIADEVEESTEERSLQISRRISTSGLDNSRKASISSIPLDFVETNRLKPLPMEILNEDTDKMALPGASF